MISSKRARARMAGATALFAVASTLALSLSLSVPSALAAGTNGDDSDLPEGRSLTDLLFDTQSNWQEIPITGYPALPSDRNLLPFTLDRPSPLTFLIDSKSISISKDGIVRYTVVIESPTGTRNIRYEGIRCANFSWRLYSGTNSTGTAWDNASTSWTRIESGSPNAYQATLFNDYFCDGKSTATKLSTIIDNIRYGRSLRDNEYR